MINLTEKAKQVLKDLENNGFNGVEFVQCRVENLDKPEPGEQTQEQLDEFNKNYAIFIAEPDFLEFMYDMRHEDTPYIEHHFHEDKYRKDLLEHFYDQFGKDVEIKVRSGCSEYEVIRKNIDLTKFFII